MSNDEFFNSNPIQPAGGANSEGPITDMDTLFGTAVNQEDVRQTQADSLKPVGSYVTLPTLNLQASRVDMTRNSVSPSGAKDRLMFRFFGPAQMTVTEKNAKAAGQPAGSIVKGQFGFGISPERANKLKNGADSGEPDGASQRWAQAVKAYEVAYKAKPATMGDVVRYVQNYPVVIRVIQVGVPSEAYPEPDGEPGNVVMAISPVREQA